MTRILHTPSNHTAFYLDASYLITWRMLSHLDHVHSHRVTKEVVEEIRAGKNISQNAILDNLLTDSNVVDRNLFAALGAGHAYDLLLSLSSTLHPFLYDDIEAVSRQNLPPEEQYKQCMNIVDKVSRNGSIWRSDHNFFHKHPDIFGELPDIPPRDYHREAKNMFPRSQNSWHKYHRNRFRAELNGTYRWTEERIIAAAAVEAFLFSKRAIIMTNDEDFDTVLFQFLNNMILLHCQDEAKTRGISKEEFWPFFYRESTRLNEESLRVQEERFEQIKKEVEAGDLFGCLCRIAGSGDIIVYYVTKGGGSFHYFPQWLIQPVLRRTRAPANWRKGAIP